MNDEPHDFWQWREKKGGQSVNQRNRSSTDWQIYINNNDDDNYDRHTSIF